MAMHGASEDERQQPQATVQVIDLDRELAYWRNHYREIAHRPDLRFDDMVPALKLGMDAYLRTRGERFEDLTERMADTYARVRGNSRLDWQRALPVAEAAWRRLESLSSPHWVTRH
ncbi:MAG TPA: hypothetical protein VEY50_07915 [Lysobacter sp.]|nr:hypothetical protein [Lysobacter sp.]